MTHKIVVTFDLSEFGEHVLETAIPEATATQAEVYLLHVAPPARETAAGERNFDALGEAQGAALLGHLPQARTHEIETATQASERERYEVLNYLNRVAPRFTGLKVTPEVRFGSSPAIEIVKYAGEIGADKIVMATHGRSALAHVVLGSVAAAVVRSSTVPVLLKRPTALPRHPDDLHGDRL